MPTTDIACNICGGREFDDYRSRGKIRCVNCGSNERHRLFCMYLDSLVDLGGVRTALHFAPENGHILSYLSERIGAGYCPKDHDVALYSGISTGKTAVQRFDLCVDVYDLPDEHYDLIIHNHVLEHLPCDYNAVIWHLHRSLKNDGLHMFSIPILGGTYDEFIGEMSAAERERRFGLHDHIRRFGRDDLDVSLSILADLDKHLSVVPSDHFTEEQLAAANIPKNRWHKFTGATPFMLRKGDLNPSFQLRSAPCNKAVSRARPTVSPDNQSDGAGGQSRLNELMWSHSILNADYRRLLHERDQLARERDAILRSRTWRFTAPARNIYRAAKRTLRSLLPGPRS